MTYNIAYIVDFEAFYVTRLDRDDEWHHEGFWKDSEGLINLVAEVDESVLNCPSNIGPYPLMFAVQKWMEVNPDKAAAMFDLMKERAHASRKT